MTVAGSNLGCTTSAFDYYTTWSLVIFILSLVVYITLMFYEGRGFARGKFVFVARCIVLWGIANAFAVGIVGHIAVSYLADAKLFNNDAHERTQLIDDFMHLLPLLVWAIILAADSDRILQGTGWPTIAFVLIILVVVVVLYGVIPAEIKVTQSYLFPDVIVPKNNTCRSKTVYDIYEGRNISNKKARGLDKMKLVYFRYQSNENRVIAMAVVMPVIFVLFVVMFVLMAAYKRSKLIHEVFEYNKIQVTDKMGNKADNKMGNKADNKMGNKADNKMGNKADNKMGNKADNKMGNKAGNNKAGNNKIGNKAGNKVGRKMIRS